MESSNSCLMFCYSVKKATKAACLHVPCTSFYRRFVESSAASSCYISGNIGNPSQPDSRRKITRNFCMSEVLLESYKEMSKKNRMPSSANQEH